MMIDENGEICKILLVVAGSLVTVDQILLLQNGDKHVNCKWMDISTRLVTYLFKSADHIECSDDGAKVNCGM